MFKRILVAVNASEQAAWALDAGAELARRAGVHASHVENVLAVARYPVSLDAPVGEDADIADFVVEDHGTERVLSVGRRRYRTHYSERLIRLLIARKGLARAPLYFPFKETRGRFFLARLFGYLAARGAPGVFAAFTGADLREVWRAPSPALGPPGMRTPSRWPLTADKVRYVGDPVAVVVAESRAAAADALELVDVDYEPLAAVPDVEAALAVKTLVHDDVDGNVPEPSPECTGEAPADIRPHLR